MRVTTEKKAENARNSRRHRLVWKTTIVCIVVVSMNVAGNYALARGLRQVGAIDTWSPLPYLEAFFRLWVGVGVGFMVAWLIARLALLSWADLSYVLLVTSFSYVFSAMAGALGLNEKVTWVQWAGICVITLGALLVAVTYPRTTENSEAEG